MQTSVFKWGIIGPGRIANRFAQGLSAVENAKLYAVASSSVERGAKFAEQYGADQVYDQYEALISDANVDAIYIASPHKFHFDTAKQCLVGGKPVLCEKPLTVSANQAKELMDIARAKNVFLMEALWSRFLPVWKQVRSWIDNGEIGDVKLMSSQFGFLIEKDASDRWFNRDLAGGVLLDMGVYNLSLSQFVAKANPKSFKVDGFVGSTLVDERMSGILNYGDMVSQFTCNFQVNTENEFRIYGTKGSIKVDPMFWDTTKATLFKADGTTESFDEPFLSSGFEYEAIEVMECIQQRKIQSDVVSWEDTLATQQLMDDMLAEVGVEYPFLTE